MNRLWQKISLKQFKLGAVAALFAGDLALCGFIYQNFIAFLKSPLLGANMELFFKQMSAVDPQTAALLGVGMQDPAFVQEFSIKIAHTLEVMLLLVLCFQALFYFFYYRKAIVAYYYIYLVGFCGILTDLLIILGSGFRGVLYYYFFLQLILYVLVIIGLFHYGEAYKKERWAAKMAKYQQTAN